MRTGNTRRVRIRLTLITADDCRRDVVVDAPAGTDVTDLRPEVARAIGGPPEPAWWSGRRQLPDTALLGGPGLRAGDEVRLGGPGDATDDDPAPLHLAVTGGPGAGRVLPLGRGVHLLGRSEVCDLRLPDAEVSRRHAAVTVTSAGISVRDLDSRNGTTVAGEEIDRDGDDLEPGDEIRLGHSTVVLRSDLGVPVPVRRAAAGGRGRRSRLVPAHLAVPRVRRAHALGRAGNRGRGPVELAVGPATRRGGPRRGRRAVPSSTSGSAGRRTTRPARRPPRPGALWTGRSRSDLAAVATTHR